METICFRFIFVSILTLYLYHTTDDIPKMPLERCDKKVYFFDTLQVSI